MNAKKSEILKPLRNYSLSFYLSQTYITIWPTFILIGRVLVILTNAAFASVDQRVRSHGMMSSSLHFVDSRSTVWKFDGIRWTLKQIKLIQQRIANNKCT